MKIAIHIPAGFTEKGERSNNEDCIHPFPGTATADDSLFLVCDGVGGENKGELASSLACYTLSRYFTSCPGQPINGEYIADALTQTRLAFENLGNENPETTGMASTMTLLYLDEKGAALAHLGDSRIYHVRNGKIIYRTNDHKWVNELVASGVLTEEQAREHPKKNMITKVIGAARNDQPEIKFIGDVQAGDYFFLCTDGVLEQVYDELLEYHLRVNSDNQDAVSTIMERIKAECMGRTNDNFSAYLVRVKSVNNAQNDSI